MRVHLSGNSEFMSESFRPKALITGASSGIGAAFARELASRGYDLIITGRRVEEINTIAEHIRNDYNAAVEVHILDFSNKNRFNEFLKTVKKDKHIRVLINNAGFGNHAYFSESDAEMHQKMTDVHIIAPMQLTHAVLPVMKDKNQGIIINVSSIASFLIMPKSSIYSASKSFLTVFTEVLYMELANTNILVQALSPGLTKTDFHQKQDSLSIKTNLIQWMEPEEIVKKALKKLSKRKVNCIPGFQAKFLHFMVAILPKKMFYKLMIYASRSAD